MQKLLSELRRLYLLDEQQYREPGKDGSGDLTSAILEQHLRGEKTVTLDLVTPDGLTRVLLIAFHGAAEGKGEQHWSALCEVAHAMQATLELPAPAVSISGGDGNGGYGLWLSLETPVPVAQAREFSALLLGAYSPDIDGQNVSVAELPPCCKRPAASGPRSSIPAWAPRSPRSRRWTWRRRSMRKPLFWMACAASAPGSSHAHSICCAGSRARRSRRILPLRM